MLQLGSSGYTGLEAVAPFRSRLAQSLAATRITDFPLHKTFTTADLGQVILLFGMTRRSWQGNGMSMGEVQKALK